MKFVLLLFLFFLFPFVNAYETLEFIPVTQGSLSYQSFSPFTFSQTPVVGYSQLYMPQTIYFQAGANSLSSQYPPGSIYATSDSCDSNGNLLELFDVNYFSNYFGLDSPPFDEAGVIRVYPAELVGNSNSPWACEGYRSIDAIGNVASTPAFFVWSFGATVTSPGNPGPFINQVTYSNNLPGSINVASALITAQPGTTLNTLYVMGPMQGNTLPAIQYITSLPSLNNVVLAPITLNRQVDTVTGAFIPTVYHICAFQTNNLFSCEPIEI